MTACKTLESLVNNMAKTTVNKLHSTILASHFSGLSGLDSCPLNSLKQISYRSADLLMPASRIKVMKSSFSTCTFANVNFDGQQCICKCHSCGQSWNQCQSTMTMRHDMCWELKKNILWNNIPYSTYLENSVSERNGLSLCEWLPPLAAPAPPLTTTLIGPEAPAPGLQYALLSVIML